MGGIFAPSSKLGRPLLDDDDGGRVGNAPLSSSSESSNGLGCCWEENGDGAGRPDGVMVKVVVYSGTVGSLWVANQPTGSGNWGYFFRR